MLKIHVFRHGRANYSQGSLLGLEKANDLQLGVKEELWRELALIMPTTKQARALMHDEKVFEEPFNFLCSTYGRAVQTAEILYARARGGNRRISGPIWRRAELDELGNFDYDLFRVLVYGGKYQGMKILQAHSNPNNLNDHEFVYSGQLETAKTRLMSTMYRTQLSVRVRDSEPISSALDRCLSIMEMQISEPFSTGRVVIITHDFFTGFLAAMATKGRDTRTRLFSLPPGESVELWRFDERLWFVAYHGVGRMYECSLRDMKAEFLREMGHPEFAK